MKITGIFNIQPIDVRGTKGDKYGKFTRVGPKRDLVGEFATAARKHGS